MSNHHFTVLSIKQVLLAIVGIYTTQTIITSLTTQALPTLWRDAGVSLQFIGLTALLWIPWGLRFLWSPLMERWRLPENQLIRRSRGLILTGQWLIVSLFLLISLLVWWGILELSQSAVVFLTILLFTALVAATTDIASDGFTVEQLAEQQRGWGNTAQVGSSYLGAMLGSGGFLLICVHWNLATAFLLLALIILLLSVPMFLLREPPRSSTAILTHRPSLKYAWSRATIRISLVLMLLSSVGIRLTLGMFGPFLIDKGASLSDVGWLFGSLNITVGFMGAILGGILVQTKPSWQAVIIALAIELVVLFALTLLADSVSLSILMFLISLMFAVFSVLWVALYSVLMSVASPLQSGVDFTLFQSADALLAVLAGLLAGSLAQYLGYTACFGLAAVSVVVAIGAIIYQTKRVA
ncbi:MFS transporter [Lonepinella koalarum]|uniref:MFS transporter n=1 Tax=Lonepinella koalarum TaxID=53417 RepID=UPI003F6DAAB9